MHTWTTLLLVLLVFFLNCKNLISNLLLLDNTLESVVKSKMVMMWISCKVMWISCNYIELFNWIFASLKIAPPLIKLKSWVVKLWTDLCLTVPLPADGRDATALPGLRAAPTDVALDDAGYDRNTALTLHNTIQTQHKHTATIETQHKYTATIETQHKYIATIETQQ